MREKGGTGKLRSHWERAIFKVTNKKPNLPVYVIENIRNKKDKRTVHRNMLMNCNDLPEDVFEEGNECKKVKVKKKEKKLVEEEVNEVEDESMEDFAVFLHEDVADFSCGGGDAVPDVSTSGDAVPDVSTSLDAEGDLVPEPADLVSASEDESEPDMEDDPVISDPDDDPVAEPLRKSVRFHKAPKIFTYAEIGGPPELIDVKLPSSNKSNS